MKKVLSLLTLVIVILTISSIAFAEGTELSIAINGVKQTFEQEPIIKDGRTLVPLRALSESLGAYVDFESSVKGIIVYSNRKLVALCIYGTDIDYYNIQPQEQLENFKIIDTSRKKMDVPATVYNGRTYVPLRVISEGLGAQVSWKSESNTIEINYDYIGEALKVKIGIDKIEFPKANVPLPTAIQTPTPTATSDIKVTLNGNSVVSSEKVFIHEGNVMLPVESLLNYHLGLKFIYGYNANNNHAKNVKIWNDYQYVIVEENQDDITTYEYNKQNLWFSYHEDYLSCVFKDGKAFVSLDVIDGIGYVYAKWDAETRTVKMTYNYVGNEITRTEKAAEYNIESNSTLQTPKTFSVGDRVMFSIFTGTVMNVKSDSVQVLWTETTNKQSSAAYVAEKERSTGIKIGSTNWQPTWALMKSPY